MTINALFAKKDITEEEVKHELNEMEINQSPGNHGLTK